MIQYKIEQWKGLSYITTIPAETLRHWHKTKKPCPLCKTAVSKQGRVVFDLDATLHWLKDIGKLHHCKQLTY